LATPPARAPVSERVDGVLFGAQKRSPMKMQLQRTARTWLVAATAAVTLTAGLSACGGGSERPAAEIGDTLTYGLLQGPDSLNPAVGVYDMLREITTDPILKLQADGSVGKSLAVKWGYVTDDNTSFEFTLRDDAVFSDGTSVNAAAVKTWLEYYSKGRASAVPMMGTLKSIDTPDDLTVRITVGEPNPFIPQLLTNSYGWGSVQSPKAVAKPASLDSATFGAGPYVLDSAQTVPGDSYTFVPNPHYYDPDRVHWKKIVTRVIANPSSRLQALQTGEIQGGSADPATLAAAGDAGLQVFPVRVVEQAFLLTDPAGDKLKAMGDVRVRQALNYAVDRKALTKALYPKGATPTNQFATFDGTTDKAEGMYPYDVDKAKGLLAEAGYPNGFEVEVMSLDFAGPDFTKVMQAVATYWEKIGVRVKITPTQDLADYMGSLNGSATIVQAAPQYSFPMFAAYPLYLAPGGRFHPSNHSDEILRDLFAKGRVAKDPKPIWEKMTVRVAEQAYSVPVMNPPSGVVAAKGIDGIEVSDAVYLPVLPDWKPAS
jgi:peptide/nickel transport system substrate-binding protein